MKHQAIAAERQRRVVACRQAIQRAAALCLIERRGGRAVVRRLANLSRRLRRVERYVYAHLLEPATVQDRVFAARLHLGAYFENCRCAGRLVWLRRTARLQQHALRLESLASQNAGHTWGPVFGRNAGTASFTTGASRPRCAETDPK